MAIKDQAGNNVPFLNQLTGEDESSRRALAPGSRKIINRGYRQARLDKTNPTGAIANPG